MKSLYWLTQKLGDVPEGDDWLTADERKHLAGLRFAKRRNDWKLGRWTAKRAVRACFPDIASSLTSIEISATTDGAPQALLTGRENPILISISHSHGLSLCVIGRDDIAVGCDIELVEPLKNNFFDDYFTPEEQAAVRRVPEGERMRLSYLIWSAKESVLKILRQGLRRDTRSVIAEIDLSKSGKLWKPWTGRCAESSRLFNGWWRICDDYVLTVAADHPTSLPVELRV